MRNTGYPLIEIGDHREVDSTDATEQYEFT